MELKGNAVGIFLTIFVVILLGITFTSVVGNSSYDATNLYTKVNESILFTSGAGTAANKCIESISFFGNDTQTSTAAGSIVIGSSLNFTRLSDTSTGDDLKLNSTLTQRYNMTYNYGCNYVDHPLSRTFLNLNTLWFALFVLGVSIVLVLRTYPELFNF